jgi:CRISPR/Cas system-associated exonuclease Cas4 (RecB family)
MELPAKEFYYFTEGKEAHKVIQDHVSEKKIDQRLIDAGIVGKRFYFPVVEEIEKDPNCEIKFDINKEYSLHGFIDGFNHENKSFLEIKTGTGWSLGKFHKLVQRKIYAVGIPDYKESVLITCTRDLKDFKKFAVPLTQKDREEALEWIKEGMKIINKGKFDGGENIDCPRCVYNEVCQWRQK